MEKQEYELNCSHIQAISETKIQIKHLLLVSPQNDYQFCVFHIKLHTLEKKYLKIEWHSNRKDPEMFPRSFFILKSRFLSNVTQRLGHAVKG